MVSELYTASTTESTPLDEFKKALAPAVYAMNGLHNLVHRSPLAQRHIESLEPYLYNQITQKETASDLDPNDTTLEVICARQEQRVGRETLCLITMFQSSLAALTRPKILPKHTVSFSYYRDLSLQADQI